MTWGRVMVRWRQWSEELTATVRRADHLQLVLIAVVIGLLGGLCAVGFRMLIKWLNLVFWREGEYSLDYLRQLPVWWKLVAPAVGGLGVGWIIQRFASEARGHGVPEVMEAVALRDGRIRPRVVLAKMIGSGICIGSGGSVGREGPIVQIGSALGSTIGQWLRVDRDRLPTLVGCGAAAGIAGTFNAPVAGALFAVEIILGDFGVSQFSPIVISSVAATVVSQHYLGDFPAFIVPTYDLVNGYELLAYAGLGLLAGMAALLFVQTLYATEDAMDRVDVPLPVKAMAGGLVIGMIGLIAPEVFGVGYEAINEALNGSLVWYVMLTLVLAKILAVSVTIGSGGSGGIFAPSLFIGAMMGGAVGTVVHSIWPAGTAGPGAYALVGMGAVVAAGTHAPITAILIMFELTGEYSIILPLMISCIIATLLATRLQVDSIYTMKLRRRGVQLHRGRALNVLDGIAVGDEVRQDYVAVTPDAPLAKIITEFLSHGGQTIFVVGEDGTMEGVIPEDRIRIGMQDRALLSDLVIAQDLMIPGTAMALSATDSLADVMRRLGQYRGEIPVVDGDRLVGAVWPQDVINRYNSEIFRREMVMGERGPGDNRVLDTDDETRIAEVPVPPGLVGRTIRELGVRQRYGLSILLVRSAARGTGRAAAVPDADYAFQPGDITVVLGTDSAIRRFRHARGPRSVGRRTTDVAR